MHVLVTGGTGYIGSHTVVELLAAQHEVTILDNLSGSSLTALDHIEAIAGKRPNFIKGDIADISLIANTLRDNHIEAIIHFAAFKAVGESVADPLKYYFNNVGGMVGLLEAAMQQHIKHFVFSSSAAVYGNPPETLVTEDTACSPASPYGWSKRMDEIVLQDLCTAQPELHGVALRYFNVVGAHDSGKIGESPVAPPQNLLPIIIEAVAGLRPPLTVYGTDYPTPDGTCLRDYIHVVDLAKAHVAALQKITAEDAGGYHVYNIGTGTPTSVTEMIAAFERVNGVKVPYTLGPRRAGDPIAFYASADKANQELGWQATKTVENAVADAWRWHQTMGPGPIR